MASHYGLLICFIELRAMGLPERRRRSRGWKPGVSGLQAGQGMVIQHATRLLRHEISIVFIELHAMGVAGTVPKVQEVGAWS